MISFLFYLTMVTFIIVCLFMILLVLIQKGRGGGLASAFGGMGGNTAFGSKTGDVLTWATSVVFGIFLVLGVVLNLVATKVHEQELAQRGLAVTAAPDEAVAPAPQERSDAPAAPPSTPAQRQPVQPGASTQPNP